MRLQLTGSMRKRTRAMAAVDLMPQELHSSAELQWIGAVAIHILREELTTSGLLDILAQGNRTLLTDGCINDPSGGLVLLEYDEGYWHRDRVAQDIAKSRLQLGLPGVATLVRLRRDVAPIAAEVAHAAYLEVCTQSTAPCVQARAVLDALGIPVHDALLARGVEIGILSHVELSAKAAANLRRLKDTCGRRAALHIVQRVGGVKMRLWDDAWLRNLLRFRTLVGHRNLRTALSNSVAAKLESEAWFAGLERLGALIGGNEHLKTALSNSVAARLESEAWFASFERLARIVTAAQICSLVSRGCIACRLGECVAFLESIDDRDAKCSAMVTAAGRGRAPLLRLIGITA